ncbi:MAG: hypothetical protein O2958_01665 [Gemmatimonadetes bacterium]|nr:hypothetical protein [Gemmatimonadota bacterium]MDA1102193.1 hypothetical protein [Gemmatimonadota bacterium]
MKRMMMGAAVGLLGSLACAPASVPEQSGETGVSARPSFAVRLDSESSAMEQFQLVEDDDGIRVQTGPAGIAYRSDDTVTSGPFHIEATFVQYGAPVGYREAYGMFVGGLDLEGPDLEYTYLLIRPTGDFLVKRRIGETTETLADWTPHAAVRSVTADDDEPENTLAVDVFDGDARFLVNGEVVFAFPAARVRPYGIAGIRVNHRLDVRIDDWRIENSSNQS